MVLALIVQIGLELIVNPQPIRLAEPILVLEIPVAEVMPLARVEEVESGRPVRGFAAAVISPDQGIGALFLLCCEETADTCIETKTISCLVVSLAALNHCEATLPNGFTALKAIGKLVTLKDSFIFDIAPGYNPVIVTPLLHHTIVKLLIVGKFLGVSNITPHVVSDGIVVYFGFVTRNRYSDRHRDCNCRSVCNDREVKEEKD